MDDRAIVYRCAEAMGYTWIPKGSAIQGSVNYTWEKFALEGSYNPLTDDAQAMALVKRFRLELKCVMETWHVWDQYVTKPAVLNRDLNRAICLAVATMQEGKDG